MTASKPPRSLTMRRSAFFFAVVLLAEGSSGASSPLDSSSCFMILADSNYMVCIKLLFGTIQEANKLDEK